MSLYGGAKSYVVTFGSGTGGIFHERTSIGLLAPFTGETMTTSTTCVTCQKHQFEIHRLRNALGMLSGHLRDYIPPNRPWKGPADTAVEYIKEVLDGLGGADIMTQDGSPAPRESGQATGQMTLGAAPSPMQPCWCPYCGEPHGVHRSEEKPV